MTLQQCASRKYPLSMLFYIPNKFHVIYEAQPQMGAKARIRSGDEYLCLPLRITLHDVRMFKATSCKFPNSELIQCPVPVAVTQDVFQNGIPQTFGFYNRDSTANARDVATFSRAAMPQGVSNRMNAGDQYSCGRTLLVHQLRDTVLAISVMGMCPSCRAQLPAQGSATHAKVFDSGAHEFWKNVFINCRSRSRS